MTQPKTIDDLGIQMAKAILKEDLRQLLIGRCKELITPFISDCSIEGTKRAVREMERRQERCKELMRLGNLKEKDLK